MVRMQIMGDGSEIIQYDRAGLPLYVQQEMLSYYPDMRAECHWHEDIELIYILSGKMNYYISGEKILLSKGDFLFVNTGELHYGYDNDKEECSFICILFDTVILQACDQIYTESIEPLLKDNNFLFLSLHENKIITSEIKKIIFSKKRTNKNNSVYELKAVGALYKILSEIYKIYSSENLSQKIRKSAKTKDRDSILLKKMVTFIRSHYKEKISLSQIAGACNISKSKCCNFSAEKRIQVRLFF